MDTKGRILIVAKKEFILNGYANASLRKIADECNISATALYRHFKNKEAIFDAVLEPLVNKFDNISKEVEQLDYELLKQNRLDEVWSIENNQSFHFELLFAENMDLVKLAVKERKEWFKRLILDVEKESTYKYLDKMRDIGYNIKDFNKIAFESLMDSYLEAYINLLKLNVAKEELLEICKVINEFYTVGFRNMLGF